LNDEHFFSWSFWFVKINIISFLQFTYTKNRSKN
jgi:hypothetical protein